MSDAIEGMNICPHECRTSDDFQSVGTYNGETGLYGLFAQRAGKVVLKTLLTKAELECVANHIVQLLEDDPEQASPESN